ncbi:MAG TPA: NAD(P)-binding domain-containing protein [Longimicrobiales bacterium]|nr:NAD(P)-binding domain-containing protein [Longimicrobiales bacterium]
MNIAILGSGMVGQNLGAVLARKDHDVVLGTRSPDALSVKRGPQSLREWLAQAGERARVGTFAEAAAHGEVVVNATNGQASLEALRMAGAANFAGKILMDIANPLDFSRGMPPRLSICNDDSLGERIQAAFPDARVVKTLNTTNTYLMGDPGQLAGGDHTIFVSGNDAAAKAQVTTWLREWFGWRDVIDLGDITTARGTEMVLPVWVRLYGALGTPMFNFKVVR